MTFAIVHIDLEDLAAAITPGESIAVSVTEAHQLLASQEFVRSSGWPLVGARHFRAELGDGGCLHLVVDGDGARLHRDRHHPDRSLQSLAKHLIFDAPQYTFPVLAVVLIVACAIGSPRKVT